MVVFNKTNKIIGIGGAPVLPLGFAAVPDSFKTNPILQRMADEGRISINPSERAASGSKEAAFTDIPADDSMPAAEASGYALREPVPTDAPQDEPAQPDESQSKKKMSKL